MLSIRSGLFCPVLGLLSCPVCDGVLWPNGWMDQDETWHRGRPQPKPHCVRWDRAPSQKGTAPQYSARVYRGQTAGWIKVPLGVEVGLSPGDIVLDGDPAPPTKGAQQRPNFRRCLLWSTAEWIKMPLGTKVSLGPGHFVLYGDPAPLPQKSGVQESPNFRPGFIVSKRLGGSRCHLVWR